MRIPHKTSLNTKHVTKKEEAGMRQEKPVPLKVPIVLGFFFVAYAKEVMKMEETRMRREKFYHENIS